MQNQANNNQSVELPSNNNDSINSSNQKYNPDVIKKFKEIANHTNNKISPDYVDSYYKSITNQPVKKIIKSVNDLKLESDKPDASLLESNYDKAIKERLQEQLIAKKAIDEYNINNTNKLTPIIKTRDFSNINKQSNEKIHSEPIEKSNKSIEVSYHVNEKLPVQNVQQSSDIIADTSDNIHLKLKSDFTSYTLKENDKLLNEKKRFNKILEDLDSLL